ncbi:MAG: glycosyltransferase family 1 protein [Chloroflexi bacterium]|nr:MAG: glycosyltransferase family 1 protein [Chloroflexota bacterium]
MHILHVVQGYTPALGGTERLIQKVSEKLVERHGDRVTVFTTTAYNCELFWRRDQPQLPVGVEEINGVTVHRFPVFNRLNGVRRYLAGASYKFRLPYNDWLRALYNGPIIPQMPRAIARAGADVIAGSSFPLLHMHYMLWGGRRAGVPVVLHGGIHTADAFGFDRPMIYKAIRQADAYIANTRFEKEYLVEKQSIAEDKITVIGVGVDLELFARGNGRSLREYLGWNNAPIIAFVGQQVPHKGIDLIMQAMPAIWQNHPNACLLIAGAQTTFSATIQQWHNHLPPEQHQRVAILNNFPEEQKPDIFAAADMLVFPSGHESFGIVFLEAWAAQKPVIGSRIGAIPTVVDEGKDGLLTTHRDLNELIRAINTLLSNPALRHELGTNGYHKVRTHYTWDIVADKFRQVYTNVLSPLPTP